MQLKLSIERLNKSYTLKPGKSVVVGSNPDCDIVFPAKVQEKSLRFRFRETTQSWTVDALSDSGMLVNSKPSRHEVLRDVTRIKVKGATLVATPEVAREPITSGYSTSNGSARSRPMPPNENLHELSDLQPVQSFNSLQDRQPPHRSSINSSSRYSPTGALSWANFVANRVNQPSRDWGTKFYLITGLRKTIWVKTHSSADQASSNSLNAFDGFIIPNFKGSIDNVVGVIEQQVSQLGGYDDTDCKPVRLTDAHIADSTYQPFFDVQFWAVRRSLKNTPDYRRFYVTTYHRVRNYLLVETYGKDLFVSWITRFEPEENCRKPLTMLIIPSLLSMALLVTERPSVFLFPLFVWAEIYWLTPAIMAGANILPKGANARLIIGVLILLTMMITGLGSAIGFFLTPQYYF